MEYKGFTYTPTPKTAWDNLSMLEKSEMMRVAVRNGITDLKTIKEQYNEFAEGGYLDWKEKASKYKHLNIDNDRTYDYERWYNENPQRAWNFLNDSPDAHFDDKYKTVYHPTFSTQSKYSGKKDATYNPLGLAGGTWNKQGTVFTMSPDGYRGPVSMDERKWYLENAEDNGVQLREADGSLPIFDGIPWGGVLPNITITGNKFAEGGIHIKPENRGKFTALKERTGHSATWFKEHGTPAQKKMAIFALNSRHWKHGLGGNLFDGTSEDTQQMQVAKPDATYVAGPLVAPSLPKKHYDWEDAATNRAYQVFSNYDEAKDETMPWAITKMRNVARWVKDNIYDGFPSGVSNCTLTTTQWVDPNNPIARAKSIHKNPERYNYTKVDSTEIVPGNVLITRNPNNNSYHTMLVTGFAGQDSTAIFDGIAYPVKKGEPLLTYSRGGHDNSFIRRNIPLSAYTPNSDGKTENLFYRYNYPREVFLPEVIIKPKRKKR